MQVFIGADHGGYHLKNELKKYIKELGHLTTDIGATELDSQDDYPDIARELGKQIKQLDDLANVRAILICSSGAGMCICANKIKGMRGALCKAPETAYFARLHNDINVLCLSGLRSNTESIERVTEGDYHNLIDAGMVTANLNESKRIVKVFLETESEAKPDTRHARRIAKITDLENEQCLC